MTAIRFTTFPSTDPPPSFVQSIVQVFIVAEEAISTILLDKGLESDAVLARLRPQLVELGFAAEAGKRAQDQIRRPVFFGENGKATLTYQIDAFHDEWRCGLEIEAGRAVYGNAIYRDLIQAMIMVQVDHLCLAVPNMYKHANGTNDGYRHTVEVARALYGHRRVAVPYGLTVIGY